MVLDDVQDGHSFSRSNNHKVMGPKLGEGLSLVEGSFQIWEGERKGEYVELKMLYGDAEKMVAFTLPFRPSPAPRWVGPIDLESTSIRKIIQKLNQRACCF